MEWKTNESSTTRRRFKEGLCPISLTIFFFFFMCVCVTYYKSFSDSPKTLSERSLMALKGYGDDEKNNWFKNHEDRDGARRLLGGPGSSPPRCTSKCGGCTPCKAVHVAVPPGTPVTAEYYPEAWRCKCGNKFYMP